MTPRSKKLLALVTYGISLYARATCESRAQDLAELLPRLGCGRNPNGCERPQTSGLPN